MDRSLFIFAGAATLLLGAVSLEMHPASPNAEVSRVKAVEASPAVVMSRLKRMTVLQFLRQFNDRRGLDFLLSERVTQVSENEAKLEVRFAGDHVLSIFAKVAPLDAGHAAYEIKAELPPSRLTASGRLHSGDIPNAEAVVILLVEDYLARSFGIQLDSNSGAGQKLLDTLHLSDKEARVLGERFMAALGEAYGQEVKKANYQADQSAQAEYEADHGLGSGEAPAGWRADEPARRALEGAE